MRVFVWLYDADVAAKLYDLFDSTDIFFLFTNKIMLDAPKLKGFVK